MGIRHTLKSIMPEVFYPYYLRYRYRKLFGKKLDFNNPVTYTEKMQVAKLRRRNPLLTELTDKILARNWVESRIGAQYLIPILGGPYTDPDMIDFSALPDKFVIKTNHGSGTNIIVKDKSQIDEDEIKKRLKKYLKCNFAYYSFELQYKDIDPMIYIEKYMLPEGATDLPDYKFFCFNGKVFCLYVMINTFPDHHAANLGIFDRDFTLLEYYREDFKTISHQLEKPENYGEMLEIAETLSKGFSHVRVDLYNINGKIYFGEMTFTTGGGLFKHEPEKFDRILGDCWDIDSGI